MAETPVGYFPDVRIRFSPSLAHQFETDVERDRFSGREQRRGASVAAGQRVWRSETIPQDQEPRRIISEFLNAKRGQLYPFCFFPPAPYKVINSSVGSVTAQSSLILPWKDSVITDVRVGGVTKAFTSRALDPRDGTYATLRFDGTNDYVDGGSGASLKTTGDVTIAAWIYNVSAGGEQVICGNFGFPGPGGHGVVLRRSAAGVLVFYSGHAGGFASAACTTAVPSGTWTHVAAVKSGLNVTFYINGVAKNTVGAVTTQVVSSSNFIIGKDALSAALYWNGMLQGVRYYDAALSAGEVLNIYNSNATASANLKGHWMLTEGTGTSVTDYSGYGNTATLGAASAAPTWVAGEDEVTFSAGAQTGAVTVSLTGRPRLTVRSLKDIVGQGFLQQVADVRAIFPLEFLELPA